MQPLGAPMRMHLHLRCLVVALLLAAGSTGAAHAQDGAAAPSRFSAVIEGPRVGHRSRYANVTVERTPNGRWLLEGCHAVVRGACRRTRRVRLDAPSSRRLDALLEAVRGMPRCEPIAHGSMSRPYRIQLGEMTRDGHLPEDAAEAGPCGALGRLAQFLWEEMSP